MTLAQTNKEMRKELESLTKEARVLSAIHGTLLRFMSENQRDQIKSEVRKSLSTQFTEEELSSYRKRNSGRLGCNTLEYEALKIIQPEEVK